MSEETNFHSEKIVLLTEEISAPATRDWCGCCEQPYADLNIKVTLSYGSLEIEVTDVDGDEVR